ncbi:hypothetical protein M2369_001899 [Bacillus sp. JUb11]|nr:hypothetical protein [Bacillus sp. JUb11]
MTVLQRLSLDIHKVIDLPDEAGIHFHLSNHV